VYARAVAFEKQHGDRTGIEDIIVGERRFQYEEEVIFVVLPVGGI
jgi:crooked neck